MCACTYVCMCVCMYVCMYVHTYVCVYVHTYVCVHVCTYVCVLPTRQDIMSCPMCPEISRYGLPEFVSQFAVTRL